MTSDVEAKIKKAVSSAPWKRNSQIADNYRRWNVTADDVARIREQISAPSPCQSKQIDNAPAGPLVIAGVSVANRNVLSRRPVESAAKYIKRLKRGMAYAISDCAKAWGMSEETIRKHARDMGCLKFVEVEEDEWQAMVMHPETAGQFKN